MNLKRLYRGPWLWILAIGLLLFAVFQFTELGSGSEPEKVDTSRVYDLIAQDEIDNARLIDKEQRIELTTTDGQVYEAYWVAGQGQQLAQQLEDLEQDGNLKSYDVEVPQDSMFVSLLFSFLPLVIIIVIFLFIMNQMQGGGGRVMNFGKSKAKLITKDTPKSTFADVAGADEAIEELQEIKEFLQNPAKFQAMGAKIPKGVLLFGPPGTGKTLLARAVAGEAGVPFYSISGSDFVEMFVGVGASRVRDLFEQAKANAPAIIFIDEIDAVGRHRGAGMGGGHDEREQTLNQMLVEMDGFDIKGGVILIAATNRPDILDPALLRPGRFDRQIVVDRPDMEGRKGILQVHVKGKPVADDVDLDVIARRTSGMTGADLANVINEGALLSARAGRSQIDMATLEEAIDRVMAGPERKTRVMSDAEKKVIAYHEGGHALVGHALPNADPVHKITILPRGRALGYTMSVPLEDKFLTSRSQMMDQLAMMLGGRAAEEMVFHEPTTGAANDIDKATSLARNMVTEYGMSERLGARKFGSGNTEPFLGREMSHSREYSEEIASVIDEEVRRLIESAHDEAWEILLEYREVLDDLVLRLLDKETLSKEEVLEVFAPVVKRPARGSYTGYGKRQPSTQPPVKTPKELALLGPRDVEELAAGNGQSGWTGGSWPGGERAAEPAERTDTDLGSAGGLNGRQVGESEDGPGDPRER
ncbi:ATP-dependent zinc metalloprotease FtsH [Streptomonospora sp. S1-112]|uniref:ATP-dependent zinc metalloprotease FtsH n=1 Tax=Streptomonospora mangrovi TaxID=2883123 RepID=A0A9X3NK59_9ACTN|nr:ATP-dependent zinc metalloprotease FtsH [Streptomonospora mangrovi]MDA0563566.1 ATP-dependent zinc metalloprotease FtsH [Streptomonospora mangrovi]